MAFLKSKRSFLILSLTILIIIMVSIYLFLSLKPKSISNRSNLPASSVTPILPTIAPATLSEALTTKGRLPQDQKIAQVGQEIIYGRDLNYILYQDFPSSFYSNTATPEALIQTALPSAVNNSILLQASYPPGTPGSPTGGNQNNSNFLTPDIFNNPNKDETLRQQKIQEITNARRKSNETVSGALITVWLHNVDPPSIPYPDADKLAKDTITGLYNRLISGQMTFREAGAFIRNDQELSKIDFNYRGNAYYEFKDQNVNVPPFTFSQLNSVIESLDTGQMSQIIRVPDASSAPGTKEEEFYAIIKVYNRTNQGNGNIGNWIDSQRAKFTVTIF